MSGSSRIERTAADWLVRTQRDDFSAADRVQLEEWLAVSTAHRIAWLRLRSIWEEAGRLRAIAAGHAAGAVPAQEGLLFARTGSRGSRPRRRRRLLAALGSVAILALLAGAGIIGWQQQHAVARSTHATVTGELDSFALADGSEVTLSSGSRIDVALSRQRREVDVAAGEAFFDVARDAARPFVVRVDGWDVVAVGTRFGVRREVAGLRLVVTEGTVRLEQRGEAAAPSLLLPAGSVTTADRHGALTRSMPLEEARSFLDWRRGLVHFQDTRLADAIAELNRYTTRPILIADASLADLRVGGNFRWDNSEAFVRLLQQILPVEARTTPDGIALHQR